MGYQRDAADGGPAPMQTSGASGVLSVASISLLWLNVVDMGCSVRTGTSKAWGAACTLHHPLLHPKALGKGSSFPPPSSRGQC